MILLSLKSYTVQEEASANLQERHQNNIEHVIVGDWLAYKPVRAEHLGARLRH